MKGAVERIIDACTQVQTAEGLVPLDKEMEETILANVEALAEQGLRVLGLAQKSWTAQGGEPERAEVEDSMILQGLVGLYGEFARCTLHDRIVLIVEPLQTLLAPRPREPFAAATTPVSKFTCSPEITPPPLEPLLCKSASSLAT